MNDSFLACSWKYPKVVDRTKYESWVIIGSDIERMVIARVTSKYKTGGQGIPLLKFTGISDGFKLKVGTLHTSAGNECRTAGVHLKNDGWGEGNEIRRFIKAFKGC